MTKPEIQDYLQHLENRLLNKEPRNSIQLNRAWANQFPETAAVYIFREGDEVCYVGETGSFKGRMTDLLNTKNHTIRRNIGSLHYSNHKDFEKASSKKSYHPEIEILLNKKIINDLTVSFIEIELGRKELEEQLYEKYRPKYAIKGKRKSGEVCLNGPAARRVQKGDIIIIISYAQMTPEEAKTFQPKIIFPDEKTNLLT